MAAYTLQQTSETSWNWLRISGLSGSFVVHLAACLMLAVPVVVPALKPAPQVITTRILEAPPELPVTRLPPEPVPMKLPKKPEAVVPTPRPIVVEDSVIAAPVTMPDSTVITSDIPDAIADTSPAPAANVSLAYESIIEPRYPMDSRRRGEQGTVVLRVLVGRDGLPVKVDIARSSGYRQLDRAARDAVLRWRFRPVQLHGVKVEASGLVPIRFDVNQG
ncbi:MAG TPA: energy transducer TonB [Dokdonella sp.]|uniref:energy transducer TonB n=1 Tax=Dokdonella sp. TaxID=2291710 RepID=UPI002D808B54|nr:energy transducer TonB [Dokdonella sp.]HET9032262.1 energy transducer TonB [Dokdonella sp.]